MTFSLFETLATEEGYHFLIMNGTGCLADSVYNQPIANETVQRLEGGSTGPSLQYYSDSTGPSLTGLC